MAGSRPEKNDPKVYHQPILNLVTVGRLLGMRPTSQHLVDCYNRELPPARRYESMSWTPIRDGPRDVTPAQAGIEGGVWLDSSHFVVPAQAGMSECSSFERRGPLEG